MIYDELAEKALLGAMLLNPKTIAAVLDRIVASDFYLPKHQAVFTAISDLYAVGRPVDEVAVAGELSACKQLKRVGGAPYLLELSQSVPLAQNVGVYVSAVAEKASLRRLSDVGVQLQHLAATEGFSSDEILAQAHGLFREIDRPDNSAADFVSLVQLWRDWDQQPHDVIPTPWPEVNSWLCGGLGKGRLIAIGGRPSVGKSLGGLNIAVNAAEQGHCAIFFSLEMGKEEVATRILSSGSGVDLGDLVRRRLEPAGLSQVSVYAERFAAMPLWVDDRERLTVEQIAAKCRSIPDLSVAVIDYLQLVTASDAKVSREQQVAHISRSLKILAKELNIAVVVAAQLNRGPVKDGKPREPTIADLRESGAVEQDSDQVLLLHREDPAVDVVRMICGKNRIGATGDVELKFEGRFARLSSFTGDEQCERELGWN